MQKSLVPTVALSGLLALGLAGCGSSSNPTVSAAGATPSTSATSAPPVGDSTDANELATRISNAMVKAKSGKGKISTTGGTASAGVTGTLQFQLDGTTTEAQGSFVVAGTTLEVVTKDGIIYIKGMPSRMTGGKPWVKIDPKGTDELSKSMSKLGNNTGDPRALVDSFKGGKATVKSRSGGQTTYEITGASALAGGALEVTVDEQDLPSTFKVTTSGVTVTAEYSDWGAPVSVIVPPADQVGSPAMPTG